MLLAVFSDTHGCTAPMRRAVLAHAPDAVLHLGDCARDADVLRGAFPALDVRGVRGNCDFGGAAPDKLLFELAGVSVFMTHGHLYGVKYGLDSLLNAAGFTGAKLVLYGHTHLADYQEQGGVILLNPGSAGTGARPSFALVRLENGTAACKILDIPGGYL